MVLLGERVERGGGVRHVDSTPHPERWRAIGEGGDEAELWMSKRKLLEVAGYIGKGEMENAYLTPWVCMQLMRGESRWPSNTVGYAFVFSPGLFNIPARFFPACWLQVDSECSLPTYSFWPGLVFFFPSHPFIRTHTWTLEPHWMWGSVVVVQCFFVS